MNKVFVVILALVFFLGQFARYEFGNGVSLVGIDVVVGFFSLYWFGKTIILQRKISSSLVLPTLIFLGFCMQSLVVNLTWLHPSSLTVAFLYVVRFFSYVGLFFYVREFSKSDIRWVMKGFLSVIVVVVFLGILQNLYYPSLRNLFYLGWDDHLYRLFSVFLDPNFTGALLVCFFLFLLYFVKDYKTYDVYKKIGYSLLLFSTTVSIFLTYSRTAYVMFITGSILYLVLVGRKKLVFVLGLGVVLMLFFTVDTKVEGLNPFRTVSSSARLNSYQIATDIFMKHPVLGVGFNTYRYAQNMYGYRNTGTWQTSHADAGTDNSFLFVLVTTGVLGFTSYLFFWYRILSSIIRRVKNGEYLAKITLSTIIALFVGAMFLNVLFYPFIMAWYFILLGITENTSQ